MDYNADLEFSLTFPSHDALFAAIKAASPLTASGFDDFSAIIDGISESTDWTNPEDDPLTFVGWGGGKLLWDHEDMLKVLADAGVTGIIDGRGEDGALWRWRFADGEYKDYPGMIVYPAAPYVQPEGS
jgi:hypothetical protein